MSEIEWMPKVECC